MVRKKALEQLLKEKDDAIKQRDEEIEKLNESIDFIKSRLEEKDIIIGQLREKKELSELFGLETISTTCVSKIFECIEKGRHERAKNLLDALFYNRQNKEVRFFKFADDYRKEFFSPDRGSQIINAKLKEAWLFMKHKDRERADLSSRINQVIRNARNNCDCSINIPDTIQVYEYILIKEVIGPDLFDFYNELNNRYRNIATVAKEALLDAIIDEQLEYNAFIRNQDYGFSESQLVFPSYEEKMLEFYRKHGISLSPSQEKKVVGLVSHLNKRAKYPVRDSIPMNYRIIEEDASYFLSEEFMHQAELQKNLPSSNIYSDIYKDVKNRLRKSFFSYDHDDLIKRSFQSEDNILALECYAPLIPAKKRAEYEQRSVQKLGRAGENTEHYWDYRNIEGWIKHSRWALVRQENPKYRDTSERAYWQHHIGVAHASLFLHVFKRQPYAGEIEKITPERTLTELVMHPDCRAQAII